jgi:hypothetical protein
MPVATFVGEVQTPVRTRGWVVCPHGTTWPSDSFVTRFSYFDANQFRHQTFKNHQRRYAECDCTLSED